MSLRRDDGACVVYLGFTHSKTRLKVLYNPKNLPGEYRKMGTQDVVNSNLFLRSFTSYIYVK